MKDLCITVPVLHLASASSSSTSVVGAAEHHRPAAHYKRKLDRRSCRQARNLGSCHGMKPARGGRGDGGTSWLERRFWTSVCWYCVTIHFRSQCIKQETLHSLEDVSMLATENNMGHDSLPPTMFAFLLRPLNQRQFQGVSLISLSRSGRGAQPSEDRSNHQLSEPGGEARRQNPPEQRTFCRRVPAGAG